MQQSNAFASLAVNVVQGSYDEDPALKLSTLGGRLKLSDAPLNVISLPASANLLSVSNAGGLLAAGTSNGFILARLEDVRKAIVAAPAHQDTPFAALRTISTPSPVVAVHFANRDQCLLVSLLAGGVALYGVAGLVDGSKLEPEHVFSIATPVAILPNPGERAELVAILAEQGRVSIVDLSTRAELATFGEQATAFCWSVLGKQIMIGGAGCQLQQYAPTGELKSTTPAPPSDVDTASSQITDIRWLENMVLVVSYGPSTANPSALSSIFAIIRSKDTTAFVKLDDPVYPLPDYETRQSRRLVASLKDWPPYKHVLLLGNVTSNQLAIFASDKDSGAWATLDVDEAARPVLPSTADFVETVPLGIAVDLASNEPTVLKASEEPLPPAPILLAYSSQGLLIAWSLRVASNAPYSGLLASSSTPQAPNMLVAPSVDAMETSTPALATSSAPSPFAQTSIAPASASPFGGGSITSSPSFGQSSIPSINKPSAFGGTGFAQAAFGASAFGKAAFSSSPFASASKAASSPPAPSAASPSTFAPSAGSGFSGFAAKSQGSTFAGFAPPKAEAPASTTFGAPSAFGPTATPAFGQFGSSSEQKTTFGTAGSTGFGFGAPPSSTSSSKTSAFSFSSVRSGAGGAGDEDEMADDGAKETANKPRGVLDDPDDLEPSGKSAPSGLSFGDMGLGRASSTAPDAVPTAFAPSASTSAFGAAAFSRPAVTSAPAFAVPPSAAPTVTPSTAEAPKATASPAFGASAFGQSGFGQSSFGKSGFTGFGSSAPSTPTHTEPSKPQAITGSAFSGFAASKSSFSPAAPSTPMKEERQVETKKPAPPFSAFASAKSAFSAPSTPEAKGVAAVQTSSSPFAAFSSSQSRFAVPEATKEPSPQSVAEKQPEQRPDDRYYVDEETTPVQAEAKASKAPSDEPVDDAATDAESETEELESETADDEGRKTPDDPPKSSAKALFGMASSPPSAKTNSLLERLGPPVAQPEPDRGEESDPELEDESYEYESDEEGAEGSSQDEDDVSPAKESDQGSKEEEDVSGDSATEEGQESETETAPQQSGTPSLLQRMQAAAPKTEEKPAASTLSSPFSFGGFKPPSAATADEKSASTTPLAAPQASSSPFSAFGSRASATAPAKSPDSESVSSTETITPLKEAEKPAANSKTVVAPPAFSFAAPMASKAPPAQPPKGFFSFTNTTPRTSSPLASPATNNVQETKGGFFGTPQKSSTPVASSSTPARTTSVPAKATNSVSEASSFKKEPEKKAASVSLDPKSVPAVNLPATKQVTIKKTGDNLVDQHMQLVAIMTSDLSALKAGIDKCREYAKLLGDAHWPADADPQLDALKAGSATLGDLPQLESHTQRIKAHVESSGELSKGRKRKLAALQNQVVNIRQKQEECGRLLKAKDDPDVATRVKARGLGPEQAENQRRLRRSSTAVADSLTAVEAQVARLRERLTEEELGRPGYRAPSLDSIQRTVRNISTAVSARSRELDDMTRQLSALELRNSPKPLRRRERSASPSPALVERSGSVAATPTKAVSVHVDGVEAMRRNAALQQAILATRSRPLLTKSPSPPALLALPPLQKQEMPAAVTQTDAGGLRAPAKIEFSFAGLASQVSTAVSPSSGARQRSTSGRTHGSAVKVQPKMEPAEPKASSFDWGDLPSSIQSTPPRRVSSTFEGLQPPQLLSEVQKQEGLSLHKTERLYGDEDEGTASESEVLQTISEGDEDDS